jgi:hypothetical protein
VEFLVDKVALGQLLLRVFRLSPVNIIPPWLSILIYIYITWRMNNRPFGVRNSEHSFTALTSTTEGKRPLGTRCGWEDNIKINLKEVGCEDVWSGFIWLNLRNTV